MVNSQAPVAALMMMMSQMIYPNHYLQLAPKDQVCAILLLKKCHQKLIRHIPSLVSSAFTFITAFISGILVSITLRLYKLSRNYRYVTRVLSKEKKALKQEKDFGQGHRIGAGRVWAPMPSVLRTQG